MQNDQVIPGYFHPTTVVLVDDNELFLESMSESLKRKGIKVITFSSPEKAYLYLESQARPTPLLVRQKAGEESADENFSIKIDFSAIHQKIQASEKYNEISVVIADYEMPGMRGDDFLSLIGNKSIKKILLTGKADYKTAIDLLNHKVIDSFVEKNPLRGIQSLYHQIVKLQSAYFNDLTRPLAEHLSVEISYINSVEYQEIVNEMLNTHNVAEHYLISSSGSRLMLTQEKIQLWLFITTKSEIDDWLDVANNSDNVSDDIIQGLVSYSKAPFLYGEKELNAPPSTWEKYLISLHSAGMKGNKFYYGNFLGQKKLT